MQRRDYILITKKNFHGKSITKQIFVGNYNRIDFACIENAVYWHRNITTFYEYSSKYSNSLETRSCSCGSMPKYAIQLLNGANVHMKHMQTKLQMHTPGRRRQHKTHKHTSITRKSDYNDNMHCWKIARKNLSIRTRHPLSTSTQTKTHAPLCTLGFVRIIRD